MAGLLDGDVKGWVVASGDDVAGRSFCGGVVTGVGLGAVSQATTRRPATIVAATRGSKEPIPSPPDRVCL